MDLLQVLYKGDSRDHKSQSTVPLQSKVLPSFSSPFQDVRFLGHRGRGDCSTELHRSENILPTLTSPAMNCPNPGGKVKVAIRKDITPGYMRRLERKKSLLKYNVTFFFIVAVSLQDYKCYSHENSLSHLYPLLWNCVTDNLMPCSTDHHHS